MSISCFKILSRPTFDSGVLNWEACWVVLLRAHLLPNARFCPSLSCVQVPYRVGDIAGNSVDRVVNKRGSGRAS